MTKRKYAKKRINRIRGTRGEKIRGLVLGRHPLCVRCTKRGRVREATEVDHIVPLSRGGIDSANPFENRQGLCAECHREKTNEDLGYSPRRTYGLDGWPVNDDTEAEVK
jgi:5-methylcytosine-specific restriction protein A